MDLELLLKKLSDTICVSGQEPSGMAEFKTMLTTYGTIKSDNLGNIIVTKKATNKAKNDIMLDAHIDEVGMVVTDITQEGFLKVAASGGLDPKICYGAEVIVVGKKHLKGIVCTIPPHLKSSAQRGIPDVNQLFIDIGLNASKAKEFIQPGTKIVWNANFLKLQNNIFAGKALDNRASCAALCHALELLKELEFKNTELNVIFSAQEEVGGHAAGCAAYGLKPTYCIVVDTTFAAGPGIKNVYGKLGGGPMVGISPFLNQDFSNTLINIAKKNKLPYQLEVMGGETGTNVDHFTAVLYNQKPALLSIPIKYMHSPVETVDLDDIKSTAKLIAEFVKTKEAE
ncbi:MAG: M20/M25/M40 family metallo-hydrolase [Oscillospiraceae bacterium]